MKIWRASMILDKCFYKDKPSNYEIIFIYEEVGYDDYNTNEEVPKGIKINTDFGILELEELFTDNLTNEEIKDVKNEMYVKMYEYLNHRQEIMNKNYAEKKQAIINNIIKKD